MLITYWFKLFLTNNGNTLWYAGYGLQCYVCDSEEQEACSSLDLSVLAQFLEECPDGKDYCRRSQKADRVHRTCSDSGVNVEPWCLRDDRCLSTGACQEGKFL